MTVENARNILARYPDRVELLDLPEGGIRVAIRPDPNTSLKIAAGLVIACVSSFVVGSASLTFNTRMDDFSVLVAFCPRDIRIATAWVVGAIFWGTSAIFLEDVALANATDRKAHLLVVNNPNGESGIIPPP